MRERLKSVLADVMGLPEGSVADDASPATIGTWDSLRHMNLILALEEEFSVQFDDAELSSLTSFSKICSALEAKGCA